MTVIQSWQGIIDSIRNGEPVTAEVANRAINQLAQRTEHLKTRQDAQDFASAIFISEVPFTDDVKTGNAVYFNSVAGKFAPAYADLEYKDGYLALTETSVVAGLVVYKDTPNSGTIVIEGLVDPNNYQYVDCQQVAMTTNMLLDTDTSGLLYLANGAASAGKLSSKPGLLNVPVCTLIDSSHLLVRPAITSALDSQALRFQLAAKPAGPDIVLQRKSTAGANEAFSGMASTELAAGSSVKVYRHSYGTQNVVAELYLTGTVHKFEPSSRIGEIQLKDVVITKAAISAIAATGDYSALFTAPVGSGIAISRNANGATGYTLSKGVNSSTAATASSYVPLVVNNNNSTGYTLNETYLDASMPGWLPATDSWFSGVAIPAGASYGYNFAADPVLQQLFPETVVGTYVIFKDGVAVPNNTVVTGSNGIWWKDHFNTVPWHKINSGTSAKHLLPDTNIVFDDWTLSEAGNIIQPTDLVLVYTKLISGGINVVTSLEAEENSGITITNPLGKTANSGPLVIKAGFSVSEGSTAEAGSLVVKDITGFSMKRGRVVERLLAGSNISLSSGVGGGQGEVLVSVTGLDGKLEGAPDILAIDDVLVEKDSALNLFYSAMPPAKNSSILGKVDVPNYLQGTYKLQLIVTFMAIHTGTATQSLPNLALTWVNMPKPTSGSKLNLSNCLQGQYQSPGLQPYGTPVSNKDYFTTVIDLEAANAGTGIVSAGGEVFFRLARSSTDSYGGKVGILSLRYSFVKV